MHDRSEIGLNKALAAVEDLARLARALDLLRAEGVLTHILAELHRCPHGTMGGSGLRPDHEAR